MDEAGGVDEDVDRAGLAGERRDGFVRGHVELAPLGALEARELFRIEIGRPHLRALGDERLGDGAADARRRRRHQRRLSREPPRHAVPRQMRFVMWTSRRSSSSSTRSMA